MTTIFKYKQKLFPKILVLLVFGLIAFLAFDTKIYLSFIFYSLFVGLQTLIHVYYLSKRLIVTDKVIEQRIFCGLPYNSVNWTRMIEAYDLISTPKTYQNSLQAMMEPFAFIRWFAKRKASNTVKIIIENEDPLYIHLHEIKNSSELLNILKERIKFRKR